MFLKKICRIFSSPDRFISFIINRGFLNWMNDELFLKFVYRIKTGNKLDLDNVRTFNEKIQWLKIYDRNPLYTILVDKYEVKKYVSDLIGEKYIIPTLGVWDSFDDIDFDLLPKRFVLKCTHDSGGVLIIDDKNKLDIKEAKKFMNRRLRKNYYWTGREWPYKNVKPRIIAEEYLVEEGTDQIKDYKIFNFNGVPHYIQVDYDRFTNHKRNIYNLRWEYINVSIKYPTDKEYLISKPLQLDEMIGLAQKLSEGIPFVRTDFYFVDGRIYFGELTFHHGSGYEKFTPEEFGLTLGKLIDIKCIN